MTNTADGRKQGDGAGEGGEELRHRLDDAGGGAGADDHRTPIGVPITLARRDQDG